MNLRLKETYEVQFDQIDGTWIWRIIVSESALIEFTMAFCLIFSKLISQIEIISKTSTNRIQLSKFSDDQHTPISWVDFSDRDANLLLSHVETKAIMFFCLKAVRDGKTEVDHIDIEASPRKHGKLGGTLIVKFPNSIESMRPIDVRRNLGLR